MNENYIQPAMPKGCEDGVIRGMYLLKKNSKKTSKKVVQLLGSGTILREVIAAAEILKADFGVESDIWSLTSVNELQREGKDANRWNLLHPGETSRVPYVTQLLPDSSVPVIAATDYMKSYSDQIREFIPASFTVLGTDGFGRSDTREKLRRFFEVSREYIVIAALKALVDQGELEVTVVTNAMRALGVVADKPNPLSV